jgi:hypothetical protein
MCSVSCGHSDGQDAYRLAFLPILFVVMNELSDRDWLSHALIPVIISGREVRVEQRLREERQQSRR